MFASSGKVFFQAGAQYKLGIFQRLIVNQPVQLAALKPIFRKLIFNAYRINRNL